MKQLSNVPCLVASSGSTDPLSRGGSLPCFCELPATWFLVDAPHTCGEHAPVESLSASDLFDQLCDACFYRVVTEGESKSWVRIGPKA